MADVRAARASLAGEDADRVGLAMVTVDPARDTAAVLTEYTQAFDPAAHALRTEDDAALRAAATAFGADYEVGTTPEGEVEVGHSSALYAVDDGGRARLQWTFGTPSADIASDLEALLAGPAGGG
jgi:protein SCO1/2